MSPGHCASLAPGKSRTTARPRPRHILEPRHILGPRPVSSCSWSTGQASRDSVWRRTGPGGLVLLHKGRNPDSCSPSPSKLAPRGTRPCRHRSPSFTAPGRRPAILSRPMPAPGHASPPRQELRGGPGPLGSAPSRPCDTRTVAPKTLLPSHFYSFGIRGDPPRVRPSCATPRPALSAPRVSHSHPPSTG